MRMFLEEIGVFDGDMWWSEGDRCVCVDDREVEVTIPAHLAVCVTEVKERGWERADRFEVWRGMHAQVAVCSACGGRIFEVGRHEWATYVKCTGCGMERCVHEG